MNGALAMKDGSGASVQEIGGKAFNLGLLRDAVTPIGTSFTVPPFVVIPAARLDGLADPGVITVVVTEVRDALARAGLPASPRTLLAVRSSASVEDGADHSFAGQFETVLGVRADDVEALGRAIVAVASSAGSLRATAYRAANSSDGASDGVRMSVIVQEMVDPEVAGVAFSVDPVTAQPDVAVVSAVLGLGEGLVSGELDADTYRVRTALPPEVVDRRIACKTRAMRLANGATAYVDIPEPEQDRPALSDDEAVRIGIVAAQLAERFGAPQDVEWALVASPAGGERALVMLQARPITTLPVRVGGARRIWDNSNIVESYGGVTTPLTFTFARAVYEDAYRQFFSLMGVSDAMIDQHHDALANMLGLVRGRVYYNLLNWYRVLALLPGFKFNRSFMERMMGVRESLTDTLAPATTGSRLQDLLHLVRTLARMLLESRRLPREVPAFHQRVAGVLGPLTPAGMEGLSGEDAVALYHRLERELLRHWRAPLVNDFFAMIYFGVLGRLTTSWLPGMPPTMVNDLLVGDGEIISTQPARSVMELARAARETPAVLHHFTAEANDGTVWRRLTADPGCAAFRVQCEAHLGRFGDRAMEELKLETITPADDPGILVNMVRAYLSTSAIDAKEATRREAIIRQDAEGIVRQRIRGWRRVVYTHVLSRTRLRVRDRENLRFERTRVFGVVRRLFLAVGRELAGARLLDDARDVFYLTREEVFAWYDGTSATMDLRALVRLRRAEFAAFAREPAPPDRLETDGPVAQWRGAVTDRPAAAGTPDGSLEGTGCCPGVVRGRVRIVTDPRQAGDLAGNILVAERTDPGWTLLFPIASGLLVQRGSLLSHSAIVAREMGLPCIVGIPALLARLKEDDLVEMDGSTGIVRRLVPATTET